MSTAQNTFQDVLSIAAREAGGIAALDYGLSRGEVCHALANAYYLATKARLGVPEDESPLDHGYTREDVATAQRALINDIAPYLAARTEQAKSRRYTGWSRASRGPIRYAD